jgi:hypothetical protein
LSHHQQNNTNSTHTADKTDPASVAGSIEYIPNEGHGDIAVL